MLACVVVVLDPSGEFFVEYSDVGEVERARQKALSDGAEEALDLALGGAIADGCMAEQGASTRADLGDLFGRVDRAVVDVERFGNATFIEGAAQGEDERVGVLGQDALSLVRLSAKSAWQQTRLASSMKAMSFQCLRFPFGKVRAPLAVLHVGPEHRVGLPFHREVNQPQSSLA